MRFPLVLAVLLFPLLTSAYAADLNGYTSRYECRSDGLACNVDVVALSGRPCEQTISPSAPWSSIDWSKSTICLAPGDHTAKGILTIPSSASGGPTNFRVLRHSSNSPDVEPWNQGADQAKVERIVAEGSYWLIHRITVDASNQEKAVFVSGSNVIFNRMLLQNADSRLVSMSNDANNVTVQNSVIRGTTINNNADDQCLSASKNINWRIVNNEIYDCHGDGITLSNNTIPNPGLVIENNDIYLRSTYYSDGSGNLTPNGTRACAENGIDIKTGGTAANPQRILHNRVWGFRPTDFNCANGSAGEAIIVHSGASGAFPWNADYVLIENNIVFDSPIGIAIPNGDLTLKSDHLSIIGNLIFNISSPHTPGTAIDIAKGESSEVYLNTIVSAVRGYASGGTNHDTRCNLFIDSGAASGSAGSGEIIGDNGFYNSPKFGTNAVEIAVNTRQSNTNYNEGTIARFASASTCKQSTDIGCFLYKATTTGTTLNTQSAACGSLGCIFNDGSIAWRAVRGPFRFYRKLRTTPEEVVTANAVPYFDPSQSMVCPSTFANRIDVGISN